MFNLELKVAHHVDVAETDWQCRSGDKITVGTKGAVMIKSAPPFFVELARYLEHGEAWRWGLEEKHSILKSSYSWEPTVNVFVLAVQNMRPDPIAYLAWKA